VEKRATEVVVEVGGVGLKLCVPVSSYNAIGEVGEEVQLLAFLYVREDEISLFGFATHEERELFQELVKVPGVGPRIAIALLSSLSVDEICEAVANGDEVYLASVPGVGRKTAQKIIIELREQLAKKVPQRTGVYREKDAVEDDAIAALVALGCKLSEAGRAVREARAECGDVGLEELVKEALRRLK